MTSCHRGKTESAAVDLSFVITLAAIAMLLGGGMVIGFLTSRNIFRRHLREQSDRQMVTHAELLEENAGLREETIHMGAVIERYARDASRMAQTMAEQHDEIERLNHALDAQAEANGYGDEEGL